MNIYIYIALICYKYFYVYKICNFEKIPNSMSRVYKKSIYIYIYRIVIKND